jgi:hypothetical protein
MGGEDRVFGGAAEGGRASFAGGNQAMMNGIVSTLPCCAHPSIPTYVRRKFA